MLKNIAQMRMRKRKVERYRDSIQILSYPFERNSRERNNEEEQCFDKIGRQFLRASKR